jgi:hypothetical protein
MQVILILSRSFRFKSSNNKTCPCFSGSNQAIPDLELSSVMSKSLPCHCSSSRQHESTSKQMVWVYLPFDPARHLHTTWPFNAYPAPLLIVFPPACEPYSPPCHLSKALGFTQRTVDQHTAAEDQTERWNCYDNGESEAHEGIRCRCYFIKVSCTYPRKASGVSVLGMTRSIMRCG